MRRIRFLSSLVWATVILATAVILRDLSSFVPILIVLLMGCVASDAIFIRYAVRETA